MLHPTSAISSIQSTSHLLKQVMFTYTSWHNVKALILTQVSDKENGMASVYLSVGLRSAAYVQALATVPSCSQRIDVLTSRMRAVVAACAGLRTARDIGLHVFLAELDAFAFAHRENAPQTQPQASPHHSAVA